MAKSKSAESNPAFSRSRWNIEVTEADIEKAHVNDSYRCVIATALARQIPDATRIEVDIQTIRFTRGDERFVYLTPYAAAGYVVAFDAGDAIEPFSFQLRSHVKAPRWKKTPAGRVVQQKRDHVRSARQKVARAEATLAKAVDERSPRQTRHAEEVLAQAPQEIAKAERDLADTQATYRAAKTPEATVEPGRRVPRVHKTKSRAYGQRILRVNQEPGRKHYASTR